MNKAKLEKKLHEQLEFLQSSCLLYDAGREAEACRLATSLRVLFHQTQSSVSLMHHLKMDDSLTVLSSAAGDSNLNAYVNLILSLSSPIPVRYVPRLGNQFVPVPLHVWLDGQAVFQFEGKNFSRRAIFLAAANQDGGAHVDANLKTFYKGLTEHSLVFFNGENLVYPGKAPFDPSVNHQATNAHLAIIRQFAHEVLSSASHYQWIPKSSPR